MSSGLKEWFYNIILFVMFSSLLLQMSAAKKYDKYIKFFAGLILVILVISPVVKWIGSDRILEVNYLNECFVQAADDAAEEMKNLEEMHYESVSKNYKKQIQLSIESIVNSYGYQLVNADITLNNDKENVKYLYPESISVCIQLGLHNENTLNRIVINQIESGIQDKDESGINIAKEIANFFSLEEEAVVVEIV